MNRCTYRRLPPEDADVALRTRIRELTEIRRRFGAARLYVMLRRERLVVNHKRTERVYQEEKLSLLLKKQTKRASHLRVESPGPTQPDEHWTMDF